LFRVTRRFEYTYLIKKFKSKELIRDKKDISTPSIFYLK
jgi:hypothetical protein